MGSPRVSFCSTSLAELLTSLLKSTSLLILLRKNRLRNSFQDSSEKQVGEEDLSLGLPCLGRGRHPIGGIDDDITAGELNSGSGELDGDLHTIEEIDAGELWILLWS